MKFLSNKKGFTLIELIVVVAILGILAAVAVPAVGTYIRDSRISAVKSNIETVKNAINTYYAQTGLLPGDTGAVASPDNLLSGRTMAQMSMAYNHANGAATYSLSVNATQAPYNLRSADINPTNFPAPLVVTSTQFTGAPVANNGTYVEYRNVTP